MQSEQFRSGCVAILGQPNVGKSTLLNKIIGEPLAIVTSKPQTTRNRITGILNRPNAQIVFVDTPGYHSLPRLLNQFMLGEIEKTIEESDLFCFLVDPTSDTPELDDEVIDRLIGKKTLVIINKADKIPKEKWKEYAEELKEKWSLKELFFISALTGDGVEELIQTFTDRLPEGPKFFEEEIYTEMPLRFLAAEAIREQALLLLHQELPYSLAVEVESFEEKPQITVIKANIVVEKTSHKSMVIGKEGQMIKKIGTRAREKIEFLMSDQKVFLELFVKVDHDWTTSPDKLRQYGYA
ncbi:MAG: GTPase Era [Deltaproteobacteria bacterium RIFCSPLOWO2_01_44_7]|nr:MAG: GTPase Era [Deltaproteobacteria bacterium RIFCSPHIGHO2_01_FULL_43_49]OGQ15660.1 MAG: GTPase Era [Deltaproteobacteria bacterium RIFCSPHIGHO2_02_FULL_44_53]OGQ28629.1 MAG: GTPase Era [Deltaproteobacteria bacterium RIFCSPHIGHO2_12_FULL_44_21]OGQ31951.1 MAG: GTPase Era [Deltaproteobacteria bacterium RIFCSPLOWO2_01_FULL_45_74]OGQ43566.1 MAG: GTPase Era [Deltaproteobacteria bacterium RIFCSPLOWO2_02_FULL_44_34]OGQ44182.1 MAG: GTPase Era [Deltaproteobacteria bacterium RIFCSPLOWO2_01_44_7]OGQ7